jgi:serine/threonine-protein kinase
MMVDGRHTPGATPGTDDSAEPSGGSKESATVERTCTSMPDPEPRSPLRRRNSRPPESIGGYRILGKLGEGGMGVVYEAEQPHPRRRVALKVVRGGAYIDSQFLRMFQREAETLARLKHPNIAAIYEAGSTDDGQHFFAMELVQGRTLRKYLAERPRTVSPAELEQRLRLFCTIADAVHYAHQRGVIHRDLKPTNILVDDRPFAEPTHASAHRGAEVKILDFGLARITDPEAQPSTVTTSIGEIKGTLPYMSPEQAQGEELDTRTDVYALGILLYELLVRERPYDTKRLSMVDAVRVICEQSPRPLRQLWQGTHRLDPDLETIAGKALEKDADRRYASAAALSEDVERYLNRQPILARPPSIAYQIRKLIARHREASIAAGVAALLLAGALGWGGYTRWTAGKRERMAREFGQQLERIEAMARYAHTIPLHDIRPELQAIRVEMARTEQRIATLGPSAEGPGRYALGRGEMVLRDHDAAREHLERAWAAGYRQPEVAYALGQVLGRQYTEALHEADHIPDPARRESRRQEIATRYRDPALGYLRQSGDARSSSAEYLAAQLAYYEDRHDEALAGARAAYARLPWLYEAMQLEGDVHRALAGLAQDRGELEPAEKHYEAAEAAYRRAIEVGESDPSSYAALCGLGWSRMVFEINERGAKTLPFFELGREACESALRADPDHADSHALLSGLYGRLAEYRGAVGEEPDESLQRAVEAAERALGIRPHHARAHAHLGRTRGQQAAVAGARGEDPTGFWDQAIASYERALDLRPANTSWINGLGLIYKNMGNHLERQGGDPHPAWDRAISEFQRAAEVNPEGTYAPLNIATVHHRAALHAKRRGEDPREHLNHEIDALETALRIRPDRPVVMYQLARAVRLRGSDLEDRGDDPSADYLEAARILEEAIERNPDSPHVAQFHNVVGSALSSLGRYERRLGRDPLPNFERAVTAYRSSIAGNPKLVFPRDNLSELYVDMAEHRLDLGGDPRALLERAVEEARGALEINPEYPWAYTDIADACRVRSRHELQSGLPRSSALDDGLAAVERALEINPDLMRALDLSGRLHTLRLRQRVRDRADPEPAYRAAREAYARVIELNEDEAAAHRGLAELQLWWAPTRAPGSIERAAAIESGIESADAALALSEQDGRAMAIRGALLHARVGPSPGPASGPVLDEARSWLRRAIARNAHLEGRYGPLLATIDRSLATTRR